MLKALIVITMLSSAAGAIAQTSAPKSEPAPGSAPLLPMTTNTGTVRSGAQITPRGPAPALAKVVVYGVASSQYGDWEYPPQGAFATSADHGGSVMRVAVWEQGYANSSSRIAKMSGTQLPNAYAETALCGTSTTIPYSCGSGQTVTGYMVYYDLDGYQSGSFTYQAVSLVFPNATRYTSINIQ